MGEVEDVPPQDPIILSVYLLALNDVGLKRDETCKAGQVI